MLQTRTNTFHLPQGIIVINSPYAYSSYTAIRNAKYKEEEEEENEAFHELNN